MSALIQVPQPVVMVQGIKVDCGWFSIAVMQETEATQKIFTMAMLL